ncbi:hypothetical protein ABTM69_20765, partial [Acinetobacter baumannii]
DSGPHPFQSNADDVDAAHGGTLANGYYGNSLYSFGGPKNGSLYGVATSDTVAISFEGINLQGIGDEAWGIDNVRVTSNAVPEPM